MPLYDYLTPKLDFKRKFNHPPIVSLQRTIDGADDSKISNRIISTNRITNRKFNSNSNRISKLRRSLILLLFSVAVSEQLLNGTSAHIRLFSAIY